MEANLSSQLIQGQLTMLFFSHSIDKVTLKSNFISVSTTVHQKLLPLWSVTWGDRAPVSCSTTTRYQHVVMPTGFPEARLIHNRVTPPPRSFVLLMAPIGQSARLLLIRWWAKLVEVVWGHKRCQFTSVQCSCEASATRQGLWVTPVHCCPFH